MSNTTGKKMKKCPYCGGLGYFCHIYYSTECRVCKGTGYIEDDKLY